MLAPQARSKGGQARVPAKLFEDHIIADHVVVKANIEEGHKGERVAFAVKDLHTQFRCIYPAQTKCSVEIVTALQHFVGPQDSVETIERADCCHQRVTGYRHQTSIEHVDSSKYSLEGTLRFGILMLSLEVLLLRLAF